MFELFFEEGDSARIFLSVLVGAVAFPFGLFSACLFFLEIVFELGECGGCLFVGWGPGCVSRKKRSDAGEEGGERVGEDPFGLKGVAAGKPVGVRVGVQMAPGEGAEGFPFVEQKTCQEVGFPIEDGEGFESAFDGGVG